MARAEAVAATETGDQYFALVRSCPLRVIRTEREYERAIAMLDRLSDRAGSRTSDETEYLLALAVFVEKYEEEHHAIQPVPGIDMLHYLIETHGVTQSELAVRTGLANSTISELLAGKRKLSIKHIELLARFFSVRPSLFLVAESAGRPVNTK